MHVILEPDEAWSIMTLVVSQVLDRVELSPDGRTAVRRWRTDHPEGSAAMEELAEGMNEALSGVLDERTRKLLRRKGRYVLSKEER
jgi:hypothetical protein